MTIIKPYLIQRATIALYGRTLALSTAVDFDYMGSAEFEFGALPAAFRLLKTNQNNIRQTVIEIGGQLHILHCFDDEQLSVYRDYLVQLHANKISLKERSEFPNGRADLWWDIENSVLWSYDRRYMTEYLLSNLQQSFNIIKD